MQLSQDTYFHKCTLMCSLLPITWLLTSLQTGTRTLQLLLRYMQGSSHMHVLTVGGTNTRSHTERCSVDSNSWGDGSHSQDTEVDSGNPMGTHTHSETHPDVESCTDVSMRCIHHLLPQRISKVPDGQLAPDHQGTCWQFPAGNWQSWAGT